MVWLLALLQLVYPVTNAYAAQVRKNVVISVTFTNTVPVKVCSELYAPNDTEMVTPMDSHCWKPKSVIGELDTWPNQDLRSGNFKIVVTYPGGDVDVLYLTNYINT